jgi:hypothetical protein
MEVTELFNLTTWVEQKKITSDQPDNLLEKYTQFINALQASQGGQAPFETERETLEGALGEINFSSLTRDQTDFLEKTNVLQALGQPAIEQIEEILTRNGLDINTATNKIQDMHSKLEQGLEKLKLIRNGLEDCIPDDIDEIHDSEGVLTRLSFLENASINNVVDFKKAAANWHIIGRGLAEISNSKPEDIKIIGASRGSIIFDLWLYWPVALVLQQIISWILSNTKTYYEIREISQKVKSVKLENEQKAIILKKLNEGEEDEKNKIVEETVEKTMKYLKLPEDKRSSLEASIKNLSNFLEGGGHVDFVLPPKEEGEEGEEADDAENLDALSKFREQVQETRLLLDEVKRIRHMPSENDVQQKEQSNDEQEPE